ncbi:MAG: hypothetical protein ACXWYP_08655 [Pseudonocardia sp.]
MQPSSLIFVAVVAIWAAYLVQYWIRRREHMATARSVDRFSEAMRVLERRGLAEAGSGAGDEATAKVGPEAVSVGHSPVQEANSAPGRRSPLVARAGSAQAVRPAGRSDSAPKSAKRRPHRSRSRVARRARAVGVLCAVAVVPLTAVLTMIGVVPWWTIVVAMGEVSLCLVALRLAAVREQTARHTERSMRRPATRAASPSGAAEIAPLADSDASGPPMDEAQSAAPALPAYRPGDATWNPVPVPRPTYQLKDPAPAPRPEPEPASAEEVSEPVARQPRRRVVGG